ncbi:MAG: hypothetical protein VX654_04445 [Chloroflexota bacterium]|nr:hypothetical protein [Chloroflexota bacterium]
MTNGRLRNVTANAVDAVRGYVARFSHAGPSQLRWDGASHQPRARISTVITNKG